MENDKYVIKTTDTNVVLRECKENEVDDLLEKYLVLKSIGISVEKSKVDKYTEGLM